MKKRKWMRRVLLALAFVLGILFLITLVCLSPYGVRWLHRFITTTILVKVITSPIQETPYLTYVASVITGLLAVAISILALRISRKAEQREQQSLKIEINLNKKKLYNYIENTCNKFYEIYDGVGNATELEVLRDFDRVLEVIKIHGVLSEKEQTICTIINDIVRKATNPNKPNMDYEIALEFCKTYMVHGNKIRRKPIDKVIRILDKLSE